MRKETDEKNRSNILFYSVDKLLTNIKLRLDF
jgi:hypothetical protein